MKRRVVLSTINIDARRYSLSVEFLAARILDDPLLSRNIRLFKKTFPERTPSQDIVARILRIAPDLIGFSCYVWNMTATLEIAAKIKAERPNAVIVLGGPETAGRVDKSLEAHPAIDAVVMGEGEETFAEMLGMWLEHGELTPVPGAAVRHRGRVDVGPPRPMIRELDTLPSPYEHLNASSFRIPGMQENSVPPVQTLRGCNRGCQYCYYGKNFPKVRYFSPDRISRDLDRIKACGEGIVNLIDPNFFCNPDHAGTVIRLLAEKGLRFQVEANADDLRKKNVGLLIDSTCYQINVGLQSVNPGTLKRCGRPFHRDRFEANLNQLTERAPHIPLEMDIIYGLPGDTVDDFLRTLDYAFTLPVRRIHVFRLLALPGTPFHERPEKWGIEFDPAPPHRVRKTCSFFFEDEKQIPIGNSLDYWFSSNIQCSILRFLLEKAASPPSKFLTRFIAWDAGRKRMLHGEEGRLKETRLSDLRYMLSGAREIFPGVLSEMELDYVEEWFSFNQCLLRLLRPRQEAGNADAAAMEWGLWRVSNRHVVRRFRINPPSPYAVEPEQPKPNAERFLIRKNHYNRVQIYGITGAMEGFLDYFARPRLLESYLAAPNGESPTVRRALISYARENGFIGPASS